MKKGWAWLLVAACVLSYANGLTGNFTYDDKAIVRDNPRIKTIAALPQIFTTHYFGGGLGMATSYRPIDLLSFAVNYFIHGKFTFGYHAVNLALHTANTVLLFLLLRRRFDETVAGVAALFFAVASVHVEAVTSIVGRAEVLSAFFVLLAFFAAARVRGRRGIGWFLLSSLLYLLGILTKESAVVFPGLLFLYDAAAREAPIGRSALSLLRRRGAFYAAYAIPLGASFLPRYFVLKGFLISRFAGIFELENTLVSLRFFPRLGNACAILLRGLGRTVVPLYLSADESAWQLPTLSPSQPMFWISIGAVAALLAAGLLGFRGRPAAGFGVLFFLLNVLPTSNILFATGTTMAERLMYLPSAGIALTASALVAGDTGRFFSGRGRALAVAAIVLALWGRTIARNAVWQSDRALFGNLVLTSPDSAKSHYDLAYDLADSKEHGAAFRHYRRATEIYDPYYDAWAGRGRMAGELGDLGETVRDCRKSVEIFPTYENGWFNLAFGAERRGDFAAAEAAYRDGFAKCPDSYPIAYHRAAYLWRRGRAEEAIDAFEDALDLEPDTSLAHEELGRIYRARGENKTAAEEWQEALAAFPTSGVALAGLAQLAEAKGDFDEAVVWRLRYFEASREREDLLLLFRDALRSPGGARRVLASLPKWRKAQKELFSRPEVAAGADALKHP
jgi:protein O-mannosyl-transferase